MLPPGSGSMTVMMNGKAVTRGHEETTQQIATKLSNQAGRPVTDATGLTGKYDYTLYWALPPMRGPAGPGAEAEADSGPNLFTAVQEQLGLKLEPARSVVDVLKIDHLEKPTPD